MTPGLDTPITRRAAAAVTAATSWPDPPHALRARGSTASPPALNRAQNATPAIPHGDWR